MGLHFINKFLLYFFYSDALLFFCTLFFFGHLFISAVLNFKGGGAEVSASIKILTYFKLFIFFNILFFGFKFYWVYSLNFILLPQKIFFAYCSNYFSEILCVLALVVTYISWQYLSERYISKNIFLGFYLYVFFWCTVNMVHTSSLLIMFIFFEFLFLPSIFFVYQLAYSIKAEKTIEFLLLWTLTGTLISFLGFGYFFYITGSTNIFLLSNFFFSSFEKFTLYIFFFIGFGVKIPLWPMYYWLTKVHVEAPTGFSMFLSGFLVKTAFFCFSQVYSILSSDTIAIIAVTVVFWGICESSSRMWSLTDIKRLIALATVQEMNMIVLYLFILASTNFNILANFLLIHGVLSIFLFFLVDVTYKISQTRNLLFLSGLSLINNKFHFFVWCGLLVYRGFPIFVKFFIEWELLASLLLNLYTLGFVLFLGFSMLGVAAFFRNWLTVLYGSPTFNFSSSFLINKNFANGYLLLLILFFNTFFLYIA